MPSFEGLTAGPRSLSKPACPAHGSGDPRRAREVPPKSETINNHVVLHAALSQAAAEGLTERVAQTLRDVTKLRGEIVWVRPGQLPNDGRLIEDARSYQ